MIRHHDAAGIHRCLARRRFAPGIVRYAQAEEATRVLSGQMQPLVVPPYDAMCEQGRCVTTTAAGVPVQFDKAHLSYEGARLVIERFRSQGLLASGAAAPAGASQRPAATAQPAASRK